MARVRSYKAQKAQVRYYTPPPDFADYNGQAKTPQRSAVFALRAFARKRGIEIKAEEVREITSVPPRNQTRICQSKQLRTRHNQCDSGLDPRGRTPSIKRSETAAISNYAEDDSIPLEDRSVPWLDLAEAAGVELPLTFHRKTQDDRTVTSKAVHRRCRDDEDLINTICEEEKELPPKQAKQRLEHADEELKERLHSID